MNKHCQRKEVKKFSTEGKLALKSKDPLRVADFVSTDTNNYKTNFIKS